MSLSFTQVFSSVIIQSFSMQSLSLFLLWYVIFSCYRKKRREKTNTVVTPGGDDNLLLFFLCNWQDHLLYKCLSVYVYWNSILIDGEESSALGFSTAATGDGGGRSGDFSDNDDGQLQDYLQQSSSEDDPADGVQSKSEGMKIKWKKSWWNLCTASHYFLSTEFSEDLDRSQLEGNLKQLEEDLDHHKQKRYANTNEITHRRN